MSGCSHFWAVCRRPWCPPLGRLLRNRLPGNGQPEGGRDQGRPVRSRFEPDLCRVGGALWHGDLARSAAQTPRVSHRGAIGPSPMANAKVEVAVQVAQRWILARLRNHWFFSLAELNMAIRRLLDELNMRLMRGYGASRADLFATLDRPNLQSLPSDPYVFARWKRARVAPDYHVEVDSSWYSVPFALIKQEVDVRVAGQTVEIFHRGQRVASHARTPGRRGHVPVFKFMGPTICPPRTAGLANGRPASKSGQNVGAGDEDRPCRCGFLRDGDGRPPPPRAGLPHLSGGAVPGQNLWTRACRCRLPAGRHHPRTPMFSQTATSIRSILKTGPHSNRSGPSLPGRLRRILPCPARQHSRRRLLPLRKDQNADPSHP